MSSNTAPSNQTILAPYFALNDSSFPSYIYCYVTGASSVIYSSFLITNICILLPICVYILYCGHKQLTLRGLFSSSATVSHSDCLTYHMVIMELIGVSGCAVCFAGIHRLDSNLLAAGNFLLALPWFGEAFFHILTCMERYLAVVHPIVYLNLRSNRGIQIRNASVGCVWLFCLVGMTLVLSEAFFIVGFCLLVISLAAVSFCSLSVLCVLTHAGPGEKCRENEKIDQSKKRAFSAIVIILGVLVVRLSFNIIWEVVFLTQGIKGCVIIICCTWLNLPCSLVLPLLFLHKAGKLQCNKKL